MVVPIPHSESPLGAKPPDPQMIKSFAVGALRSDVLLTLGEPEMRWENDRYLVWHRQTSNLGVLVVIAGGYSAAGGVWDIPINHFAIAEFDDHGRLVVFDQYKDEGLNRWTPEKVRARYSATRPTTGVK